ncbi:hypothetical protein DSECCO2_470960 [anaerobic digester metagenome]
MSPDGLMGIHQSALAASGLKMGSTTTSLAPRSLASRMSRGATASSRQPKAWRPARSMTPSLGMLNQAGGMWWLGMPPQHLIWDTILAESQCGRPVLMYPP